MHRPLVPILLLLLALGSVAGGAVWGLSRGHAEYMLQKLENLVERLRVLGTQPTVDLAQLRPHAPAGAQEPHPLAAAREQVIPLRQLEGECIAWVVARCGGNKTRAAEPLGIDVSTIHRRERVDSGISQCSGGALCQPAGWQGARLRAEAPRHSPCSCAWT